MAILDLFKRSAPEKLVYVLTFSLKYDMEFFSVPLKKLQVQTEYALFRSVNYFN